MPRTKTKTPTPKRPKRAATEVDTSLAALQEASIDEVWRMYNNSQTSPRGRSRVSNHRRR